jgi:hypothetical protein
MISMFRCCIHRLHLISCLEYINESLQGCMQCLIKLCLAFDESETFFLQMKHFLGCEIHGCIYKVNHNIYSSPKEAIVEATWPLTLSFLRPRMTGFLMSTIFTYSPTISNNPICIQLRTRAATRVRTRGHLLNFSSVLSI